MAGDGGKKASSGNVRVVTRVRPMAKYELEKGCKPVVSKIPHHGDGPEALQVNEGEKRWFELDAVLDVDSSQQDVYEKSGAYKSITEDLFEGFNCTILAYGQTGAGKSFTMGTAASSTGTIGEFDGLIPRACQDLFHCIQTKCDSNAHVEMSYLEVYNEEIRDLLCATDNKAQLRIRETLNGEVYVRGLQARTVRNPADVGALMDEAGSRRVVASTKMNAVSSRSHAICVLKIKGVLEDSTKFQAKLTLVDLAGSERMKKTAATGSRAQEGISINKGLFVLGQVIGALAEQRPKFKRKPPFRDSKLSRLLQDSLGGNSRTIMIACCSPADFNLEETVNTLRYATQARNIKNTATANVVQQISQEEALKLQRENTLLKAEISELQESIRKLTEDVTEEEMERSQALIFEEQRKSQRNLMVGVPSPKSKKISAGADLGATPELSSDNEEEEAPENEHPPSTDEDEEQPLGGMNLRAHFANTKTDDGEAASDEESLGLSEVLPGAKKKTYEELEKENSLLQFKLTKAKGDVRATVHEAAVELPALKVRVMMLEDELHESVALEQETMALKKELDEAKADKDSAQLAAQQLADFMEQQKQQTGFRGDELEKKRLWYFHKRLDEKWVDFVVIMLASFKEQMRLLGDYFEMVVRVVESPDILSMLGPKVEKKNWWGGGYKHADIAEEKELRHRLLGEHIKFFNARLLEIEDEIGNRSESVDSILDGLSSERTDMENELEETEFVRDFFSKKGEKLLQHLTELLTGPLFTLPLVEK